MKLVYLVFCSILLLGLQTSCKDDPKKTEETTTIEAESNSEVKEEVKETGSISVSQNSVQAKLMTTPEASTFARWTLNANLVDMLSNDEGPFTLLVPSSDAFSSLSEMKLESLSQVNNKEELATLLKNHIVEGEFSSADLTQSVKRNGTQTLRTLGGANLMVYLDGVNIMVKDKNGVVATIGKSDILARNGTVHIIDSVLTIN